MANLSGTFPKNLHPCCPKTKSYQALQSIEGNSPDYSVGGYGPRTPLESQSSMPQSVLLAAAALPTKGLVEGINLFEAMGKGFVMFWMDPSVESLTIKMLIVATQGESESDLETNCVLNP